jgi:hypothetical protein
LSAKKSVSSLQLFVETLIYPSKLRFRLIARLEPALFITSKNNRAALTPLNRHNRLAAVMTELFQRFVCSTIRTWKNRASLHSFPSFSLFMFAFPACQRPSFQLKVENYTSA